MGVGLVSVMVDGLESPPVCPERPRPYLFGGVAAQTGRQVLLLLGGQVGNDGNVQGAAADAAAVLQVQVAVPPRGQGGLQLRDGGDGGRLPVVVELGGTVLQDDLAPLWRLGGQSGQVGD